MDFVRLATFQRCSWNQWNTNVIHLAHGEAWSVVSMHWSSWWTLKSLFDGKKKMRRETHLICYCSASVSDVIGLHLNLIPLFVAKDKIKRFGIWQPNYSCNVIFTLYTKHFRIVYLTTVFSFDETSQNTITTDSGNIQTFYVLVRFVGIPSR